MKANFQCPRCRKKIKVGKRLHSDYTCPNCHTSMLISRDEKLQGHVNYKRNFLKYEHDRSTSYKDNDTTYRKHRFAKGR